MKISYFYYNIMVAKNIRIFLNDLDLKELVQDQIFHKMDLGTRIQILIKVRDLVDEKKIYILSSTLGAWRTRSLSSARPGFPR